MNFLKVVLFIAIIFQVNGDNKEVIDFQNIREVLKNDRLLQKEQKAKETEKKVQKKTVNKSVRLYNFPKENEFWSFFSEYWLVKNAPVLKWDFRKPDYGVVSTLTVLLESLGIYEKKIKILYMNSPNITHFALPSNPNEYLFTLSLPFIRTLDLSKLEISLLLLEDMIRIDHGFFLKNINTKKVKELFGTNFFGKKMDPKIMNDLLEGYDQQIHDKGFSFKQQFTVTKKMDTLLKADQKLWSTYYRLLKKIDELVKSNVMYQKHLKVYPSPELQLNWLSPKSENNKF